MAEIIVGKNEPFEHALKRFRKLLKQEGTLEEAKRHEHYEKPSEKRRKRRKR